MALFPGQFMLIGIKIDQILRCFTQPVTPPFPEIRAGKFLKEKRTQEGVGDTIPLKSRWNDFRSEFASFQCKRCSVGDAMGFPVISEIGDLHRIARGTFQAGQIVKGDLAIRGIKIVSLAINNIAGGLDDEISFADASLFSGSIRLDPGDIDTIAIVSSAEPFM